MIIKTAVGDCVLLSKEVCLEGLYRQVFYVSDNKVLVDHFTTAWNDGQLSHIVWEDAGEAAKQIKQSAFLLVKELSKNYAE